MLVLSSLFIFFFKQKTAYEMRISDWSSDVCSSDLMRDAGADFEHQAGHATDRDVRTHAGLVDHHESTVEHVELALFDEQDREPLLDRQRFQRWQDGAQRGSGNGR